MKRILGNPKANGHQQRRAVALLDPSDRTVVIEGARTTSPSIAALRDERGGGGV